MAEPTTEIVEQPSETPTRAGAPYGALKRKHPEYDAELWRKLELLGKGGFEILKNAKDFLPKLPNESDTFFKYRCENASYINHMGPVIGYLAGALFAAPQAVTKVDAKPSEQKDFWAEFAENCDLAHSTFSHFMETVVRKALLNRRAVIALDMPAAPPEGVVRNKADEEAMGLGRVWLDHVKLSEILDWKYNESADDRVPGRRKFEWLKLYRCLTDRSDPLKCSDKFREQFVIWTMQPTVKGWRACFMEFTTPERSEKDPDPKDEDIIPLTRELTATSFLELPYIEMDLGEELWLGNKAGPLAEEHYRDRSSLKSDMVKSLNEIPYIKKGSEIPGANQALPSQAQQNPNRGNNPRARYTANGWIEIGADDELGFAGPSGRAHELSKGMQDDLREEIHRSANAMSLSLANNATTVGRSGQSKREDRNAETQVLKALATIAHRVGVQVHTCASQARAEKYVWRSTGLDSFDREDRPEMVAEAPIVQALAIPSETFQVEYLSQLVGKVLKASPEQLEQIRQEISKGVKEQLEMKAQHEELLLEGLKNPPTDEEDDEGDGPPDRQSEDRQTIEA